MLTEQFCLGVNSPQDFVGAYLVKVSFVKAQTYSYLLLANLLTFLDVIVAFVVRFVQKLYASSNRRSDVPELLKKKHRKLQARHDADDDDADDDDDDDDVDTEDEVLTDTNDDDVMELKPKNSNKRKLDESSERQASPPKKTKTEVF